MINLFFVTHDYSGAQTYANELLGWLCKQTEIAVHKVYWESAYYGKYTIVEEESMVAVHIPPVTRKGHTLEKYSCRCIDLMAPLLSEKNHIIFHLNYSTHVKLGLEARKRYGAQIIYTLHYLPNYFSSFATKALNPNEVTTTGDVLDREMIARADYIICVTQFALDMLIAHYFVPETKLTVIYNGCSSKNNKLQNNNSKETVKKRLGFRDSEQIIMFVGRVQWGKGVEKLIEAFNLLSNEHENLHLILVGNGELKPLMKLCRNNFGRISFTGQLPTERVKQLYQIADIGVIPSEFEQCSYVALEMMQYCLPIVCSNAPGLKELFVNEESALLVPLTVRTDGLLGLEIILHELHLALRQLLHDKILAEKLARNAHNNWVNYYTVTRMGQATMQVYELLQTETLKQFQAFRH